MQGRLCLVHDVLHCLGGKVDSIVVGVSSAKRNEDGLLRQNEWSNSGEVMIIPYTYPHSMAG